jgi:hypothetical protein
MVMVAEAVVKPAFQVGAARLDIGEQVVAPDDLLDGKPGGASKRMADIGMAVQECA